MVPWCHSNACKTYYKLWVETTSLMIPWCRSNAVKQKTTIELRQSLGLAYDTLRSLKCVSNTTNLKVRQCFSLTHGPPMSLRCVQTQYKRWVDTTLGLTYGTLLNRVKNPYTHIHLRKYFGLTYGTLMSLKCVCKTQYKLWVETMPRPRLWYPDVAQMDVKHNATIKLRQSLGGTYDTWCRSDACTTQCKHWVETIPRHH